MAKKTVVKRAAKKPVDRRKAHGARFDESVQALKRYRESRYSKKRAARDNASHPFTLTKQEVRDFSNALYWNHKTIANATDESQPGFILNALSLAGFLYLARLEDKCNAERAEKKAAKKAKRKGK